MPSNRLRPTLTKRVLYDIEAPRLGDEQPIDPVKLATTPGLTNLDNWDRLCDNVNIVHHRAVDHQPPGLQTAPKFSQYLTGPTHGGRNCQVTHFAYRKSGAPSWQATFKSKPPVASVPQKGLNFTFPESRYSETEARRVAETVARVLDRVPCVLPRSIGVRFMFAVLNIATESTLSDGILTRYPIAWNRTDYSTDIAYFEPNSLQPMLHRFCCAPLKVDPDTIPDSPDLIVFEAYITKGGSAKPTIKTKAERKQHEAAVKFLKYISWKLSGYITTLTGLQLMRIELEEQLGVTFKRFSIWPFTFYDRKTMFTIERDLEDRLCRFIPSKRLKKDIEGIFPTILIQSLARRNINRVGNAMYERWTQTADVKTTWLAGCEVADDINSSYETVKTMSFDCGCNAVTAMSTAHSCDLCAQSSMCYRLELNERAERWCISCTSRQQRSLLINDSDSNYTTPESWIHHNLLSLLATELPHIKDLKTKHVRRTKLIARIWESLRKMLEDPEVGLWRDAYHPAVRRDVSPGTSLRGPFIDPWKMSVEAVFPLGTWNENYLVHAANNVTMTALYINRLKIVFLPSTLTFMVEYLKSERCASDTESLMAKMDIVHQIGLKTPYVKKQRMDRAYDEKKYERSRREWTLSILYPRVNQPWSPMVKFYHHKQCNDKTWEPPDADAVKELVRAMEHKFGRQLAISNDCPYPFEPWGIPDDWSWETCWWLFADRLKRMRVACNDKWDTIDTVVTIYLECVWQNLERDFKDPFGLPMVVYVRHPLRFAIAHEVHGQQMRTGWTHGLPSSIDDRDDALSNISIETCLVNYAKGNVSNDLYQQLYEDLLKIEVDSLWHERSPDEGTRAEVLEIDTDDEFDSDQGDDNDVDSDDDIFIKKEDKSEGWSLRPFALWCVLIINR